MSVVSASCYELLGVPVHVPRNELARAWSDRRRALLTAPQQYAPEELEALCARLDEAFVILSDPEASKRYRAYVAQQRGAAPTIKPDDFLHPIVAEWSARSTQIAAPASRAPEGLDPGDEALPAEPPPWLGRERASARGRIEDAIEALIERPAHSEPPVADLPDEDTVSTFDEWGDSPDNQERTRTVPMAPAMAVPAAQPLSSMAALTARRSVRSMPPLRTLPASSLPTPPWGDDEQE